MQELTPPSPDELKAARALLGMSQVQFAAALGVTNVTVAYWETEKRTPPAFLRLAIAALKDDHANSTDRLDAVSDLAVTHLEELRLDLNLLEDYVTDVGIKQTEKQREKCRLDLAERVTIMQAKCVRDLKRLQSLLNT